jgi:hypothetical protein
MTILDVYKIFKEIVKQYPQQSETYKRLQGFFVLNDNAQINTANLGKSKIYAESENLDVFYNRRWETDSYNVNDISFDFPVLVAFQNEFQSLDLNRQNYKLELYAIGKYELIEENVVWERTDVVYENQLLNVLKQFEGFVKLSGVWVHESTLTANELLLCTETAKQAFKNRNSLSFKREQVGTQRLSACTCTIDLQLSQCEFLTFDWN